MKHDNDSKLVALLGVVLLAAVALTYIGIRTAEHLVLRSHADDIVTRWDKIIMNMDSDQHVQDNEIIDQIQLHMSEMETALVTSGVVKLDIAGSNGNAFFQWSNSKHVYNTLNNTHLHSFWGHLSPLHNLSVQKTIVPADLPLFTKNTKIGDAYFLIDLTTVSNHMNTIGNLAFVSMLGVLGFIGLLGGTLVVRNSQFRRQQAKELIVAKEKAEEANRSKSDFIANVSHELRSPLNAIIGFSEVMASEMYGPLGKPKYREYAKDIQDSGELLLSLTNDILDLSKAEGGHVDLHEGLVDVQDVVLRVERLIVERAMKADVKFSAQVQTPIPFLVADEQKVLQILLNLCTNAIKFTQSDGRVVLSVANEHGTGIVFTVTDNGVGVSTDDIPKVLEPFGQVDDPRTRQHEGTGLGLPLSKHFVEMHDGDFIFASQKNVGTTVTVTFPEKRIER
ncbi:HAMP domain-containing sensor histidine kinase [Magnetovibrio sp. PR-2]|uniref:sensor histidine kinase n=1 Tax=Magnetovibrio sp. PR-2 TaxID=3120356 RepID=UPI002FCE3C78